MYPVWSTLETGIFGPAAAGTESAGSKLMLQRNALLGVNIEEEQDALG
jgi:hypothetical protein